jgi:prevent-host-death family protein
MKQDDNGVLVDVQDAAKQILQLIERANAGEDIVLTHQGKPVAYLAPMNIVASMSKCGLIDYEPPREWGGYWWMPSDDPEEEQEDSRG